MRLAGGVAVGSSADLVIQPWALRSSACLRFISVAGYIYVSPMLERKLGIQDTCGVCNLHGLPGILGGVGGAVSAAMASDVVYGGDIKYIFEARGAPYNRDAGTQAGYQAAALAITLGISIVGGLITGFVVSKFPVATQTRLFDDAEYWEVPHEEEHHAPESPSKGAVKTASVELTSV